MRMYRKQSGRIAENESLWESLGLSHLPRAVVSIVGAGGKTSLMFELANELAAEGRRVIVTTSTHIVYPENCQVLLMGETGSEIPGVMRNTEMDTELEQWDWKNGVLVVGGNVSKKVMGGGSVSYKMKGPDCAVFGRLAANCDVLLIEADGARMMPLKLPASHEPVIAKETDVVIGCAGIDCIGKKWMDACFRWELGKDWLPVSDGEAVIRIEDVVNIVADDRGMRKNVGGREYRVVLNKADDDKGVELAEMVGRALERDKGIFCVGTRFF